MRGDILSLVSANDTGARRLVEMTDPSVLGLCLDTGHWTFGAGGDPVAAVREFCRTEAASYKTPDRIELCAALPLTPTGKLQRSELKKMAAALRPSGS